MQRFDLSGNPSTLSLPHRDWLWAEGTRMRSGQHSVKWTLVSGCLGCIQTSALWVSEFQSQRFIFASFPERRFLPNGHPVLGPAETCTHMQEKTKKSVKY